MNNKQLSLTLCILIFSMTLFGQETGEVRFRTGPPIGELFLKIGDSTLTTTNIQLPAGSYNIQLWAPSYEPFDTILVVYPDTTIYFRKVLSHVSEYRQYQANLKEHNRKVILPKVISAGFSSLLSFTTYLAYRDAKRKLDVVYRAKADFENIGPGLIINYHELYEEKKPIYEESRKRYYALGLASMISWGATTFIFIKLSKNKKPLFESDPPPFRISTNFSYDYQSLDLRPQLQFHYTFNF